MRRLFFAKNNVAAFYQLSSTRSRYQRCLLSFCSAINLSRSTMYIVLATGLKKNIFNQRKLFEHLHYLLIRCKCKKIYMILQLCLTQVLRFLLLLSSNLEGSSSNVVFLQRRKNMVRLIFGVPREPWGPKISQRHEMRPDGTKVVCRVHFYSMTYRR